MGRELVVDLVSPYRPRRQFSPLHNRKSRWFVGVAHRRAGKTVACVNDLIKGAASCNRPNPRFAYLAPHLNQAKDVAWGYLKEFTAFLPGRKVNESELFVEFPVTTGTARIRIYGADNPDRLRGIYLDGVVLDEYGDMDPTVWSQVIRPALSDRLGWACFIGTPKGKNAFHRVWTDAATDDTWSRLLLKASETDLIASEELAAAARTMTKDEYDQEFECSFEAAVKGAYYGEEMAKAEAQGRITRVAYDPRLPVHTAWDLGMSDSTAIWFVQVVNREYRVIDYYRADGVGLDHYAKVLQERGYFYGEHHLPHDVQVRELGTGKSRLEVLRELGLRVIPGRALPVHDGIQAARMLLPLCWFDETKCKEGIEALRMYRREYDEKRQEFRNAPLHDWTSHPADAFRTFAMGYRMPWTDEEDHWHDEAGRSDHTGY